MSTQTISFVGNAQGFSPSHATGNKFCWRSDDASDDAIMTCYGVKTSGAVLGRDTVTPTTSGGKIEHASTVAFDTLLLVQYASDAAGTISLFSDNGTAATGSIHVHLNPTDGDTLILGLTGFTTTYTFKTTVASDGHIKIGATTAETADNLASAINDASTGTSTPADGTDWQLTGTAPAAANDYLSATVASDNVTLTDRIACARQLAWVVTPSNTASLTVNPIAGGIDGTALGTITAGQDSISTSTGSGVDLGSTSTDTLPPGLEGASKAVRVQGAFSLSLIRTTDPAASIASKIQLSADGTNWHDATTTVTDLDDNSAGGSQLITGTDLRAEWMRLNITTNDAVTPIEVLAQVMY